MFLNFIHLIICSFYRTNCIQIKEIFIVLPHVCLEKKEKKTVWNVPVNSNFFSLNFSKAKKLEKLNFTRRKRTIYDSHQNRNKQN
jgi:hypothetical protein